MRLTFKINKVFIVVIVLVLIAILLLVNKFYLKQQPLIEEKYDPAQYPVLMESSLSRFLAKTEELGELTADNQQQYLQLVENTMQQSLEYLVLEEDKPIHEKIMISMHILKNNIKTLNIAYKQELSNLKNYLVQLTPNNNDAN